VEPAFAHEKHEHLTGYLSQVSFERATAHEFVIFGAT